MNGQAIFGQTCGWCQLPATTSVEIEPAVYEKGEIVKASRHVPACDDHREIAAVQPPPVGNPRRRKAKGYEQTSLIDDGTGNAIRGG